MKKFKYIVYVVSFLLCIIFGFLLLMALVRLQPIGILFSLALTSGAYTINKEVKKSLYSGKEKKFRNRLRK